MLSLLYLVVSALVRLVVRAEQPGRADGSKDLEILVLGHQLRVLRRTTGRPQLRTIDRVLLAAASRAIPRDRWVAFLVTPATLLRWHRELVLIVYCEVYFTDIWDAYYGLPGVLKTTR